MDSFFLKNKNKTRPQLFYSIFAFLLFNCEGIKYAPKASSTVYLYSSSSSFPEVFKFVNICLSNIPWFPLFLHHRLPPRVEV